MYFSLIVTFLLLMGLVIAGIQNPAPIELTFLGWVFEMPLTGLIAYAALTGGSVVAVLTLPKLVRQALRKRSLRKETVELKQRLARLEQQAGAEPETGERS